MEDNLLLEAVEKYINGEMSAEEKSYFEDLRKNNQEIDQLVVEQTYFLQDLDKYSSLKNYKHNLHEVEAKLLDEGIISQSKLTGKAKVVYLWKKYKRNIGVAASIAGFISLITSGIVLSVNKKIDDGNIQELVKQINQTKTEVSKLKSSQLNTVSPKPEPRVDYRATGFLIDGKGYLITNAHVISKMKNIYVENNKGEYYTASTVYSDNTVDLAILKITDSSYKAITNLPYSIKKGNSDLGEQFFTLGYPRNEIVYGEGYVSAKSGNDGDSSSYQLTVSANPGNSGGPVLNRNGEVIAIITSKA